MKLIDVLLENVDLSSAVPEDTSYKDFAKAVAKMLREDYGEHNFGPFMEVLHAELGMNESVNEEDVTSFLKDLATKLAKEYPNLKFFSDGNRIDVVGSNNDKQDFADKNLKRDWGHGFTTFDIDDDDRGYMVRITRVNRF